MFPLFSTKRGLGRVKLDEKSSPLFSIKRGLGGVKPMKIFNNKITKERRRELRKAQTDSEAVLWRILRNKQMGGYKFFRQYGVGPYIVDFYCPLVKVVIEVDGGQHYSEEGLKHDYKREKFLKESGIRVIRFNNLDVLNNKEEVFESIQKELPQLPL